MTAPFAVSRKGGRAADEALSAVRAEVLLGRLLAGIGDWSARFAHDAAMVAVLTTNPSEDPTSINRAMAALHMYRAIEAIEEIQAALVRTRDGPVRGERAVPASRAPEEPTQGCSREPERDAAAS